MKHSIAIKRAYEERGQEDGHRILVDRLWPRGLRKEAAHVDTWAKDVAPSTELRTWFGHDPAKWGEFQRRYTQELDGNTQAWEPLLQQARKGKVTLLYSARDTEHNDAVVLQHYLQQRLGLHGRSKTAAAVH